jgi:hypothetical protein
MQNLLDRGRRIQEIRALTSRTRLEEILFDETAEETDRHAAFRTMVRCRHMSRSKAAQLLPSIRSVRLRRLIAIYLAARGEHSTKPASGARRVRSGAVPNLGGIRSEEEVDWRELVRRDPSPDVQRLALLRDDD